MSNVTVIKLYFYFSGKNFSISVIYSEFKVTCELYSNILFFSFSPLCETKIRHKIRFVFDSRLILAPQQIKLNTKELNQQLEYCI